MPPLNRMIRHMEPFRYWIITGTDSSRIAQNVEQIITARKCAIQCRSSSRWAMGVIGLSEPTRSPGGLQRR